MSAFETCDQSQNRKRQETYWNFLGLISDAHTVVDQTGVVAEQGISTVLRDNTQRDKDGQSIAVTSGLHKVQIATVLLNDHFQADGLLDLAEFELNGGVVLVAVTMVVGEDIKGFIISLLRDQPSGRLGDPFI